MILAAAVVAALGALGLAEHQRRKKKEWKVKYHQLRKELILYRVREN